MLPKKFFGFIPNYVTCPPFFSCTRDKMKVDFPNINATYEDYTIPDERAEIHLFFRLTSASLWHFSDFCDFLINNDKPDLKSFNSYVYACDLISKLKDIPESISTYASRLKIYYEQVCKQHINIIIHMSLLNISIHSLKTKEGKSEIKTSILHISNLFKK